MLTVVSLDMVGYSLIAGELERAVGSSALQLLEEKLHDLFEASLSRAGASSNDLVGRKIDTGDGQIRCFKNADLAVRFAEAIHLVGRDTQQDWWFRVGIATGDVSCSDKGKLSGYPITEASRLESAAFPGQIIVSSGTYDILSAGHKETFGPEETIVAKHQKQFTIRRRAVLPYRMPTGDEGLSAKALKFVSANPLQAAVWATSIATVGSYLARQLGKKSAEAHMSVLADLNPSDVDAHTGVLAELLASDGLAEADLWAELTDAVSNILDL